MSYSICRAENLKSQDPETSGRTKWQQHGETSTPSPGDHRETSTPPGGEVEFAQGDLSAAEEVIQSLKLRIREQDEQLKHRKEPHKCLICMVRLFSYSKPRLFERKPLAYTSKGRTPI